MTLKINTNGEAGNIIKKTATVYTNDPNHAAIVLTISGQVMFPADITPKSARLMGEAGTDIKTVIAITPPDGNPFDIVSATAETGENIRFQVQENHHAGKKAFSLHIKNQKTTPGRYADKIVLKTTSPLSPELQVRVYGIIREAGPKQAGGR